MLQQTRVEAVVPFFERFMERFPTIEDLASVDVDEVLQYWAGLGYYRRARMLHAGARVVVAQRGAKGTAENAVGEARIPSDLDGLLALPGVGPYTAAAIGSLAFGLRVPVVDGNVKRVVARVCALPLAADGRALHRECEGVGGRWMEVLRQNEAPGALNEAVMELGATVCTPRAPRCEACPLASGCQALAAGNVLAFPKPIKQKAFIDLNLTFFVAEHDGEFLLSARKSGWNVGLYEPPCVVTNEHGSVADAWLSLSLGAAKLIPLVGGVRHTITLH